MRVEQFGYGFPSREITAPLYVINHDLWIFALMLPKKVSLCKQLRRRKVYIHAEHGNVGWIKGARGAILRPRVGFYFVIIEAGKLLLIEQGREIWTRFYWPVIRRRADGSSPPLPDEMLERVDALITRGGKKMELLIRKILIAGAKTVPEDDADFEGVRKVLASFSVTRTEQAQR